MSKEGSDTKSREGWIVVEMPGRADGLSLPLPVEIVELDAIKALISAGIVTISIGGGGIPVIKNADGELEGVAAVIDKDFGNSLLARMIKADLLLISTAVEKVAINYGTPQQQWSIK